MIGPTLRSILSDLWDNDPAMAGAMDAPDLKASKPKGVKPKPGKRLTFRKKTVPNPRFRPVQPIPKRRYWRRREGN